MGCCSSAAVAPTPGGQHEEVIQKVVKWPDLSDRWQTVEYAFVPVEPEEPEYRAILKVYNSNKGPMGPTYTTQRLERKEKEIEFMVKDVYKVQNASLQSAFDQCELETSKKRSGTDTYIQVGFHGTPAKNIDSICRKGLLPAGHALNPSPMVATGQFGDNKRGMYVSQYVSGAAQYCTRNQMPLQPGEEFQVIMFLVCPGKPRYITEESPNMAPSTGSYDCHKMGNEWFLFEPRQVCPVAVICLKAVTKLPTGNTRKEYNILRSLGEGASCRVVVAEERESKEKYAMKILNANSSETDSELLFRSEVEILAPLDHPNVLKFKRAYADPHESTFNLLTSYCKGGELFDRVSHGSFSEKVASSLTRQMLEALQYVHSKKIAHRDLKPENFVFETPAEDSNMRLIDFGVAIIAEDDDPISDMAGSPYYVAPEVLDNDYNRTGAVWRAADMWSVGVIIFMFVNGYPPFNGSSQRSIFHKICRGKYKFSSRHKLSDPVKHLISRLLIMDPSKRLTATEALAHPWIARQDDQSVVPTTLIPAEVVRSLHDFHAQVKLRKAVGKLLAGQISDKTKEQLAAVFHKFDTNGDGKLSLEELSVLLRSIGRDPKDAKEVMEQFDDDKSGTLELKEFEVLHGAGLAGNKDIQAEVFKQFDKDGDGNVSAKEIEQLLQVTHEEAQKIIAEVDKDGDGRIDIKEWVHAMTKTSGK